MTMPRTKHSTERTYKNHIIWNASPNSAGIKYFTYAKNGTLRADTLKGIKQLISENK